MSEFKQLDSKANMLNEMENKIELMLAKLKWSYQTELKENKAYNKKLENISNILNSRVKQQQQQKQMLPPLIKNIIENKHYQFLVRHGEKHGKKRFVIKAYLNEINNSQNIRDLLNAIIGKNAPHLLRANLGADYYKIFHNKHISTTDEHINLLINDVVKLIEKDPKYDVYRESLHEMIP